MGPANSRLHFVVASSRRPLTLIVRSHHFMNNPLIIGLIISALSALTFLAYKHPKSFSKLYIPLCFAFLGGYAVVSAYNSAIRSSFKLLSAYIPKAMLAKAQESIGSLAIDDGIGAMFMLAGAYMLFLLFLPALIDHSETKP